MDHQTIEQEAKGNNKNADLTRIEERNTRKTTSKKKFSIDLLIFIIRKYIFLISIEIHILTSTPKLIKII